MRKYVLGLILVSCVFSSLAQEVRKTDKETVRQHLNELASDKYKGRGYAKDGMDYAAQYIAKTYQKLGLKSFGIDYYQPFVMPVVKFEGKMNVILNGRKLEAGTDFLVDPFSKSVRLKNKPVSHVNLMDEIKGLTGLALKQKWDQLKERLALSQHVQVLHQTDEFKVAMGWKGVRALSANLPEGDYIVPMTSNPLWFPAQEYRPARIIYIYGEEASNAAWINSATIQVDAELEPRFVANNVVGYIPSKNPSDKYIVFTAHYDHIGMMGKNAIFNGASDNASGTAMMLNLATYYAQYPQEDVNIMFIACAAEEAGLLGSYHYVAHPYFPLKNIDFLINLDIWGDATNGLAVVNGKEFEQEFQLVLEADKEMSADKKGFFKEIRQGETATNSDHAPFYLKGVPCFFFFTMGGPGHYHNTLDKSNTLELTNINEAADLIKLFVKKLQLK